MTSDMKAHKHVQYILARATKRLFVIRRLKSAGCGTTDLIYVYISLIRSILETACPVFQPLLTEGDKDKIERIQKIVLKIILGDSYQSYEQACINVDLKTLESRRIQMCLNFGLKCLRNPKHETLFPRAPPISTIGHLQPLMFKEPLCRTVRYEKSPVPYITKLLNAHFRQQEQNTACVNCVVPLQ